MRELVVQKRILAFRESVLEELLGQCSESQQRFFHDRIFPRGVPDDKLDSAIDLVERTVAKNEQDPSRLQ
jgi:hypothetical protein